MAARITQLWSVAQSELDREPFPNHREAALALLSSGARLTRKAGQFLGQLAVDPTPMSELQINWLAKLLVRSDLPVFAGDPAA